RATPSRRSAVRRVATALPARLVAQAAADLYYLRPVPRLRPLAIASLTLFSVACGQPGPATPTGTQTPAGPPMHCPAPIGMVPKEDCDAIADDFGAFTVQGALPHAGSGKSAEPRVDAIREVQELANKIKD